jgi:hypothetical protein
MHFLSDTLPPLIETWDKTPKDLWDKSDIWAQWVTACITFAAFWAAYRAYCAQRKEIDLLKGQISASRRAVCPEFIQATAPKFEVHCSEYPYKPASIHGTPLWQDTKPESPQGSPMKFSIFLENVIPNTDPVRIYVVPFEPANGITIDRRVRKSYAALRDVVRYDYFMITFRSDREFTLGETLKFNLIVQTAAGYIEEYGCVYILTNGLFGISKLDD